jgi:hypothetical protein
MSRIFWYLWTPFKSRIFIRHGMYNLWRKRHFDSWTDSKCCYSTGNTTSSKSDLRRARDYVRSAHECRCCSKRHTTWSCISKGKFLWHSVVWSASCNPGLSQQYTDLLHDWPLFGTVLVHANRRYYKESRVILLMDDLESHCILNAVLYARQNNIL